MHRSQAEEQHVFGDYCFGIDEYEDNALTNRSLLFEFCCETGLQATNTYFDLPDERFVTYRDLGIQAFDDISFPNFVQLDYLLLPENWRHVVLELVSTRNAQLRSHHFLLYGIFDIKVPKDRVQKVVKFDLKSLKDAQLARIF